MNDIAKHYEDKDLTPTYLTTIKSIITKLLKEYTLPIKSIIDVGCGNGSWLSVWKELEVVDILGIDGKWVDKDKLCIDLENFQQKNLEESIIINRTFDLVMSLEVAEHLSEHRADSFIEDLTKLGDLILFSAAIPNQGGRHHINEQFPQYWIEKFKQKGYGVIDIRHSIKECCRLQWWYSQNMFLFVKLESIKKYPFLSTKIEDQPVFAYVHELLLERFGKNYTGISKTEFDIFLRGISEEHRLFLSWLYGYNPVFPVIVEIGVATGASTRFWPYFLPKDGIYIGIDINLHDESQGLFAQVQKVIDFYKHDKRMNFVLGDSKSQATVHKVEQILQSRKIDLLFIDGEHSYEAAKWDYLNYEYLLNPGGIVAWHDATRNSNVSKAIEDIILLEEERGKYGAVYDLKKSPFSHYCAFDSSIGHCGIKALVKK